jgi:hypothetical protein
VYILTLKSKILVIYIILVIEPTSITYNNENDDQAESIKSSLSLKPSTRYHGVQSTS